MSRSFFARSTSYQSQVVPCRQLVQLGDSSEPEPVSIRFQTKPPDGVGSGRGEA